jgi:hypothetical protein
VGEVEAAFDPATTGTRTERQAGWLRRVLIGPPLSSTALQQERMSKKVALPVLSSDALSSVAYGRRPCSPCSCWPAPAAWTRRCRSPPPSSC